MKPVWKYALTSAQKDVLRHVLNHVRNKINGRVERAPDSTDVLSAAIARDQLDDLINLFDVGDA